MSTRRTDELLARPSPPDYGADAYVELTSELERIEHSFISVVAFRIAGELLALEASRVSEVGTARPVRRIPRRTGSVFLGLVNVRGQLEPCVSLAGALGLDASAEASAKRVLVFGNSPKRWAFRADDVGLREVDRASIAPPPATVARALDHLARGVLTLNDARITWLDAERLAAALTMSLK